MSIRMLVSSRTFAAAEDGGTPAAALDPGKAQGLHFSTLKRSIFICALLASSAPWQAKAVLATGINAIVHDSVITYQEVNALTEQTADVLRRQYSRQPEELQKRMSRAREENLQRLTEIELILHEFETAGYSLPDSVINDMVEARLRAAFGDRRTAAKTLQARGMTYEKFREQERERFIVDAMRNKNISSEIMISPQKIQNYYLANQDKFKLQDQVKMRMIVRARSRDSQGPDARALCEEILLQLKGGARFDEMASLYSQGAEAPKGGERSWDMVKDLRPELAAAVEKLNAGDISDVIDTPDTCYVIKLEEKKAAHVKPLADVREEIERDLLAQERDRLGKQWIEKLKRKTFVRYFP